MPAKQIYIRARVDQELKKESERIFQRLGFTTSEAIRIFLTQVSIRGGLPFRVERYPQLDKNEDLLLPNEMRQAAIESVYDD